MHVFTPRQTYNDINNIIYSIHSAANENIGNYYKCKEKEAI